MMTRRHFERLAVALVAARKAAEIEGLANDPCEFDELYELFVDQIALACEAYGEGRFDYAKFRDACKASL